MGFGSFFISSLERRKKQLKSLGMASGHHTWQVMNSLLLLAGPFKLPRTELLGLIEGRLGPGASLPVHGDGQAQRSNPDYPSDPKTSGQPSTRKAGGTTTPETRPQDEVS
jgi:hypothetical protein